MARRAATAVIDLVDDVTAGARSRSAGRTSDAERPGASGRPAESTASRIDAPLAVAALLLEIAGADDAVSERERWTIECMLQRQFGLGPIRAHRLLRLAERKRDRVAGVWVFTQALVHALAQAQRQLLSELMWSMARVDGQPGRSVRYTVDKLHALLRVETVHA